MESKYIATVPQPQGINSP